METMPIPVVAAVISDSEGKVMLAKRKAHLHCGGFWEFPGGKVQPGESPNQALEREMQEEMDVKIRCGELIASQTHQYPQKLIELSAFRCFLESGTPKLTDHDEIQWVKPHDIVEQQLAPADRFLITALQKTG